MLQTAKERRLLVFQTVMSFVPLKYRELQLLHIGKLCRARCGSSDSDSPSAFSRCLLLLEIWIVQFTNTAIGVAGGLVCENCCRNQKPFISTAVSGTRLTICSIYGLGFFRGGPALAKRTVLTIPFADQAAVGATVVRRVAVSLVEATRPGARQRCWRGLGSRLRLWCCLSKFALTKTPVVASLLARLTAMGTSIVLHVAVGRKVAAQS
jgi:hypothetical protein